MTLTNNYTVDLCELALVDLCELALTPCSRLDAHDAMMVLQDVLLDRGLIEVTPTSVRDHLGLVHERHEQWALAHQLRLAVVQYAELHLLWRQQERVIDAAVEEVFPGCGTASHPSRDPRHEVGTSTHHGATAHPRLPRPQLRTQCDEFRLQRQPDWVGTWER